MKKLLIFFVIASMHVAINAQVGINNDNPDSSAILDIKHDTKGVLIPRINKGDGQLDKKEGMVYYEKTKQKFQYYDTIRKNWQEVNPFEKGIADDTIRTSKHVKIENGAQFHGFGTIPVGGIIMWSGDVTGIFDNKGIGKNSMDGWVLCCGGIYTHPITNEIIQIPDLRGRFIVGYSAIDNEYVNINAGSKPTSQKTVTLVEANLPEHSHSGVAADSGEHSHWMYMKYTGYRHNDGGTEHTPIGEIGPAVAWERTGQTNNGGIHSHNVTVTSDKTIHKSEAFDIRPPYYVLAFIMRVR